MIVALINTNPELHYVSEAQALALQVNEFRLQDVLREFLRVTTEEFGYPPTTLLIDSNKDESLEIMLHADSDGETSTCSCTAQDMALGTFCADPTRLELLVFPDTQAYEAHLAEELRNRYGDLDSSDWDEIHNARDNVRVFDTERVAS